MSEEDYEYMVVTIHAKSPKAILISNETTASDEIWFPRMWVHALDHFKIDDCQIGDEVELRVERTRAYEKELL